MAGTIKQIEEPALVKVLHPGKAFAVGAFVVSFDSDDWNSRGFQSFELGDGDKESAWVEGAFLEEVPCNEEKVNALVQGSVYYPPERLGEVVVALAQTILLVAEMNVCSVEKLELHSIYPIAGREKTCPRRCARRIKLSTEETARQRADRGSDPAAHRSQWCGYFLVAVCHLASRPVDPRR